MKSSSRFVLLTAITISLLLPSGAKSSENEVSLPDSGIVELSEQSEEFSEPPIAPAELDESESESVETAIVDTVSFLKNKAPVAARALHKRTDSNNIKYKQGVPCVPMMLVDDPNTLIVCNRDAIFKAEKRTITLSRGKGVYMVGKQALYVETPLGTITLPGDSAAIIEQSENGVLRVDHLTGPPSSVAVKRWKGTKAFSAASGEEICLAPKKFPASALIPKDGVERQEISTEVGDEGITFAENKFAPKMMLDKECLLQCDSNSFFQVRKKVYNLRKTIDEQESASSLVPRCPSEQGGNMPVVILAGSDDEPDQQVKPVTLSETAVVQTPLHLTKTHCATVKFNGKTKIAFDHPSVIQISEGEALVSATACTYVKSPHSMLKMEAGTYALISVAADVTKVRNLWENSRHGITQVVDGEQFQIAAGDESLVGKNLRSIYVSASKDLVGRRLTHYMELPSGAVIHFAEVSLISLAQSSDLLSQIANSDKRDDIALNRRLNKMAAILVQISASHGMYELMQPLQWKRDLKSSSLGDVY